MRIRGRERVHGIVIARSCYLLLRGGYAAAALDSIEAGDMSETERDDKRTERHGETTPVPADAGGDTPPETDTLTELEEATGRTLSDDLTREATRLTPPEDDQEPEQ